MPFSTLLYPVLLCLPQAKESPKPPVRMIAEWEPALGAMIRWPLRLPEKCVVEMAKDDTLYLLVSEKNEAAAREKMAELEIDPDHLRVLRCSVVSEWPRDWGPHQAFDGDGKWCVIDPIFAGYPLFAREPKDGEPRMTWPTGPGDDVVNAEFAKELDARLVELPAVLTGGNFLNDGHGTAFCTQAQMHENRKHVDEEELRTLLKTHLGIHRLVVLENTEAIGIQHIDCWLKPLDSERLLVKRPPKGHPEAEPIERNLATIAKLKNAFGRPYEIVRIDCPEVPVRGMPFERSKPIAAYTNSLILNGKVLVPLYQVDGDQAAIETWKKAMPGYEVLGFPWTEWLHFDALHCRSRAVFDRDALRLTHGRLPNHVLYDADGHLVTATIQAMSGAEIDGNACRAVYRVAGTTEWQQVPLRPTGSESRWVASLPRFARKARVEYYLEARDQKGLTRTHPIGAPRARHSFDVRE